MRIRIRLGHIEIKTDLKIKITFVRKRKRK